MEAYDKNKDGFIEKREYYKCMKYLYGLSKRTDIILLNIIKYKKK